MIRLKKVHEKKGIKTSQFPIEQIQNKLGSKLWKAVSKRRLKSIFHFMTCRLTAVNQTLQNF